VGLIFSAVADGPRQSRAFGTTPTGAAGCLAGWRSCLAAFGRYGISKDF
jgi:hypothetical protein